MSPSPSPTCAERRLHAVLQYAGLGLVALAAPFGAVALTREPPPLELTPRQQWELDLRMAEEYGWAEEVERVLAEGTDEEVYRVVIGLVRRRGDRFPVGRWEETWNRFDLRGSRGWPPGPDADFYAFLKGDGPDEPGLKGAFHVEIDVHDWWNPSPTYTGPLLAHPERLAIYERALVDALALPETDQGEVFKTLAALDSKAAIQAGLEAWRRNPRFHAARYIMRARGWRIAEVHGRLGKIHGFSHCAPWPAEELPTEQLLPPRWCYRGGQPVPPHEVEPLRQAILAGGEGESAALSVLVAAGVEDHSIVPFLIERVREPRVLADARLTTLYTVAIFACLLDTTDADLAWRAFDALLGLQNDAADGALASWMDWALSNARAGGRIPVRPLAWFALRLVREQRGGWTARRWDANALERVLERLRARDG